MRLGRGSDRRWPGPCDAAGRGWQSVDRRRNSLRVDAARWQNRVRESGHVAQVLGRPAVKDGDGRSRRVAMTSRWIAGVVGAAFAGVGLVSCGGSSGGDGLTIAFFTKNQTNPYFQSIRQGADSAASQVGASVIHY